MDLNNINTKFDQFIAEMDSTLWPIPGQEMNNRAASHQALPSLQALIKSPEDTDPDKLINASRGFGTPLEHVVQHLTEAFAKLEEVKNLYIRAKTSAVYQGRDEQQKTLDVLIERINNTQKYIFKTIDVMEPLNLASLGIDNILEK